MQSNTANLATQRGDIITLYGNLGTHSQGKNARERLEIGQKATCMHRKSMAVARVLELRGMPGMTLNFFMAIKRGPGSFPLFETNVLFEMIHVPCV